jgi:uroporphyrinogen-III decarboxylase
MPQGGFYHDILVRQQPFSEETLSVEKQIEEYKLLSEEDLLYYQREAQRLYHETDYAIVFSGVPGTNLGDIAFIPAPALPNPQGIRDIEEWYISLLTRQNFVKEVFAQITEIGLKNLRLFHQAVGNQIQVIVISGADFGSQTGPFVSPQVYRELFKPFHQQINQWIHENTTWKTFIHTCGAIYDLLPDLKEAGFDILNPVQISAPGMEPERLKSEFGDHFTFWGGGVNTQSTLPFGSPEEVRTEVQRLIEIFRRNGGFVFATVHNIQANIPLPNLIALFETISHYR